MIFKKRSNMSSGKTLLTLILLVIIFAGVFYIINASKLTLEQDGVKISGPYGVTLKYDDIQEISINQSLPEKLIRTNGIDFFGSFLGNFKTDNMDKVKLFVMSKKSPTIYIKTKNNENVIFNTKDRQETEALFNDINSKIKK